MSFCSFVSLKQLAAVSMLVMTILASRDAIKLIQADIPELLSIPQDGSKNGLMLIAKALNTSTPILRSDDGSYTLQFVPYFYPKNESRLLLTVLNTAYDTSTIIWIANRNHPVSPNASLFVKLPSRNFLLQDVDGFIAWSPPIDNIHTILMNSTGNFIMYDGHNATIWQSFDNATDVLVPGQIVRTNHSVISRLSLEDVSEGHYTLHMQPGGAVLYASFDWQQHMVPYAIVTYAGQGLDVFGTAQVYKALHSSCNHTNLIYKMDGTGVALQQEGSIITPQCKAELGNEVDGTHEIEFGTRLGGVGFRFLRLMPYGDINSFRSTNSGVALDNQFFGGMFLSFCRLPSFCGINSLCSSRDNCTCPDMFEPIDDTGASRAGCRLVEPLNCSISSQHKFLAMPMLDYFANDHLDASSVSSPEECQSLCLANCSCTTAFYNNATGKCHVYDQVQTMLPGSDPSITAYLRVARLPITNLPGRSSISKKVIIGVTTGIAMMVVITLLFVGWIGRRIMNKPNEESDSEEEAFLESLPGLPPRFTYKELNSATEGFSKKLGTGGSGTVYEGHILPAEFHRNNKQLTKKTLGQQDFLLKVAVKELQLSRFATIAASSKKQFRAEVATLGSLSHVNLVRLRGFCAEGAHRLLIYEFLDNGSLDRWIFNSVTPLEWEARYRIATDTAKGLAFLHEGSRDKVVHFDVKPQNILLDANFRAKLADFGLCKLVERDEERGVAGRESQTVTAMRGTPGYMAPEWFLNLPVTDRSDVFSYGMVLLELVGGRKNLNLAASSEDEWYFPAWAVQQAENGNLLDVIDQELTQHSSAAMCSAMTRLLHVAFWCIQENAGSRPSMSTVLLMLEEHLQVPDPPLDRTYILRRQSRPHPTFTSTSTPTTTSYSTSARASTLVSGINSELEPR